MSNYRSILRPLYDAGAPADFIESFRRGVLEAGLGGGDRYDERTTRSLSEMLAGWVKNRKRDGEAARSDIEGLVYQLCHFVNLANACSDARESYWGLLTVTDANDGAFERAIEARVRRAGWHRGGFRRVPGGIEITYPDGAFTVWFRQMPILSALHDFLMFADWKAERADGGTDGEPDDSQDTGDGAASEPAVLANAQEVRTAIDDLLRDPAAISEATIRAAASRISRAQYQYRWRDADASKHAIAKFRAIEQFLAQASGTNTGGEPEILPDGALRYAAATADRVEEAEVDDAVILQFWQKHNGGTDWRKFRTVVDAFVLFCVLAARSSERRAAEDAADIDGGDLRESTDQEGRGESGIGSMPGSMQDADGGQVAFADLLPVGLNRYGAAGGGPHWTAEMQQDWASPLARLADAAMVKRYLGSEENRRRLQRPLAMGPMALELPGSMLRAEVFGALQEALGQAKRRRASLAELTEILATPSAPDYAGTHEAYAALAETLMEPLAAASYLAHRNEVAASKTAVEGSVPSVHDAALSRGQLSFKRLQKGRKTWGFSGMTDAEIAADAATGRDVLLQISGVLRNLATYLPRRVHPSLKVAYDADRGVFTAALSNLYLPRTSP